MRVTVVVDAPGKLNLALDITGKLDNGYHRIRTIMQSVDLCDTITVTRLSGRGIFISCDRPRIPCDESNFAHMAAKKFMEAFSLESGLSIDLQKRLPMQAGLAGGSADAAGVLVGLNKLFHIDASMERLCEIGLSVGADVPFEILGGTRLAENMGECFTPLPPLPHCYVVVAKPLQGISTAASYARYDELIKEREPQRPDIPAMIKDLEGGDLKAAAAGMRNVLELSADLPEVFQLKERMLQCGALGSLMSGSGSAVFGLFDSRRLAKKCMHHLYNLAHGVFLCQPVGHGAAVSGTYDT